MQFDPNKRLTLDEAIQYLASKGRKITPAELTNTFVTEGFDPDQDLYTDNLDTIIETEPNALPPQSTEPSQSDIPTVEVDGILPPEMLAQADVDCQQIETALTQYYVDRLTAARTNALASAGRQVFTAGSLTSGSTAAQLKGV